jgi:hypothetical protein
MAQLPNLSRLLLGDDRAVVPLGTWLKRYMEGQGRPEMMPGWTPQSPEVRATATTAAHPPADW